VHDISAAAAGDVDAVRVDKVLGHECQLRQDGGMPLNDVFLSSNVRDLVPNHSDWGSSHTNA